MNYTYDLTGADIEHIREFAIASATPVKKGQLVGLANNLIVTSSYINIVGVAAEEHTGAADQFNSRANGEVIRVSCSPTAVFSANAPKVTATSGSATTLVTDDASLGSLADGDFTGGWVLLAVRGASSPNKDGIGSVRRITGYTAASKTFTLASGGTIGAGDVFAVFPPIGFAKYTLAADTLNVAHTSVAGSQYLKCVGYDIPNGRVHLKAKTHVMG